MTSGGTSSGCIPSPYDNVYFDANSFGGGGQTVTINQEAYCKSMNWTGAVNSSTLGGGNQLNIYGSLILNAGMNITFNNVFYFKSNNPGNVIQTFGKTLPVSIFFDGPGGEWILQDNLNLDNGGILFYTGSLNTNNVTVSAYNFYSSGSGIRSLSLGSSVINVSYSGQWGWLVEGSNVSVNAGTSTIKMTGTSNVYFQASNFTYYDVVFESPVAHGLLYSNNATFHNVTFAGNSSIGANSFFNNLSLGTSKTTSITGTQTINGNLFCDGTPSIFASLSGGTIQKSSGTVCINYVNVSNSTVIGGATFYAGNSNNLGNNTGWLFQSCSNSIVTLLSPGNASQPGYMLSTLTPIFLWNGNSSATHYGLQLYKKVNDVYDLHYTNDNLTNTAFYLPTGFITNGSQYYWQVRARVNNNWGSYSDPYYFNINISSVTPTIYTSSAIIQTGEMITFSGNYFTANNQAKAVISSNTGYDTSITVATNNLGALIHSLLFTIPGTYTIYCKDIFTGNSSNQRSFEVRSAASNIFNITGPQNGYQTNTGENILISWRDKLETGTSYPQVNNQRSYKYIVEKSSNGGSSWVFADSLSGFDDINKTRIFNKDIIILEAGSYLIRIIDWYASNRTTGNVSIQVASATVSDLVVGFEWDHSYTTNTGKPLGVVSDGTSRFYITVSDPGNTITQATFTLSDDNGNNETRILGKVMGASNILSYDTVANAANQLSAQGVQHSNNTFWCWYVAPADFIGTGISNEDIFRKVKVKVTTNYAGGSPKEKTKEILVRRPPVFLVHGLNSSRSVWDSYMNSSSFNKFVKYPFTIGNKASYSNNAAQLLSDAGAVEYSIPATINFFRRDSKFACNQIYYIGHSMGGVVLRYAQTHYSNFYQQKNYEKGYVNKFITLDTPHRGSPLANLLEFSIPIVSTISLFDFGYLFNDYYVRNSLGFITDINNAVKDLKMNSQNFISTSFKSHVIVGDIIEGDEEFNNIPQNTIIELNINPKMYNLFRTLYFINPSFYSAMVFADLFYKSFTGSNSLANSDLIVPLNSQLSNLNLGDDITTYTINFHSESTGSPSIEVNSANRVNILLDKSYNDIVWGSLLNIQQNFSQNKTYQMNNISVDTTGIEILSPSLNDTLYTDSLFNIVFSLSDTTQLKGITIKYQDKFITDTIPQFNYNFSLSISNNMLDTQRVFVMAHYLINDSVIIAYKSVPVIIKTKDLPSELKSDAKFVYLLAGEDYYLDMNLYFQNSVSKIGTIGTRLNLTLADPTIFEYDNVNKKLTALIDGDTYVIVDYDDLVDTIYFKIRGKDIIPVELSSFTAVQNKENVILNWVTQTELNNRGFEMERKGLSDGQFLKIGFVEGNGTTTIPNNYTYTDKPAQSGKFFYRFKQIDFDGSFTYSPTVEVDFNSIPKQFALFQNYPNPFNPVTSIKYSIPYASKVKIIIYDALGQQVKQLVNEVQEPSNYEIDFNASRYASGVYFYSIHANSVDGKQNFIDTKKMVFVK